MINVQTSMTIVIFIAEILLGLTIDYGDKFTIDFNFDQGQRSSTECVGMHLLEILQQLVTP